eukprot:TRINITY_DN1902_c0_g2_i1.p1 TRINITY_DN1902_c0_g2~~TRINITY_DN1902_c0_g2_i1.p1  ORF type:complete len:258 (-),score=22.02 TRINITY_DN1902_c0_g2_i1:82-855(-)
MSESDSTVLPCNASGAACDPPHCSQGSEPVKIHFLYHLVTGFSHPDYCQLNPVMHWAVALGTPNDKCNVQTLFDESATMVANCNSGLDGFCKGLEHLNVGEEQDYKVCMQSWASYLGWYKLEDAVNARLLGWRHVGWICSANEKKAAEYIVETIRRELDLKNMTDQADYGASASGDVMWYSDNSFYQPFASYKIALPLGENELNCQNLIEIIDRLVLDNAWSEPFKLGVKKTDYAWLDQSGMAWNKCKNKNSCLSNR